MWKSYLGVFSLNHDLLIDAIARSGPSRHRKSRRSLWTRLNGVARKYRLRLGSDCVFEPRSQPADRASSILGEGMTCLMAQPSGAYIALNFCKSLRTRIALGRLEKAYLSSVKRDELRFRF